jgi:hypothetical protein
MTPETVVLFLTFLTCLITAYAAWQAKRAAQETRNSIVAQITSSLLDAYATDEMLHAMLLLSEWAKEYGANFADEYGQRRGEKYQQVENVDRARRRISHYFEKIYALWKLKLIDESIVRAVASAEQVKFLHEKVEPLEATLNPQYEKSIFDAFGSLYGISLS